jgi:hypothetical protein
MNTLKVYVDKYLTYITKRQFFLAWLAVHATDLLNCSYRLLNQETVFAYRDILTSLLLLQFFIKTGVKVMQDIDKYRQKEIGQYISCLATVGEQVDICTDVAYRLTLWYSDQIQSLAEPSKFCKHGLNVWIFN